MEGEGRGDWEGRGEERKEREGENRREEMERIAGELI